LEWLNKSVSVFWRNGRTEKRLNAIYRADHEQATLVLVTAHWTTFRVHRENGDKIDMTEPMEKLLLSWDDGLGS
jgi:hypothetical protein